ncbi:MAG: hypothetical protein JST66_11560 [Bacteroidetes bacterium]|nr:hypothetical protein [Bacteroidota bacterium]
MLFLLEIALLWSILFLTWRFQVLQGRPWGLVRLQLVLACLAETIAFVLYERGEFNRFVYNAYVLLEFIVLFCFAVQAIGPRAKLLLMIGGTVGYTVLWVRGSYPQGYDPTAFSTGTFIAGAFILFLCHTRLLFMLALRSEQPLAGDPRFWYLLSIVLYFGCIIPNAGLMTYLEAHESTIASDLITINAALAVLRYGAVMAALIISRPQPWKFRTWP